MPDKPYAITFSLVKGDATNTLYTVIQIYTPWVNDLHSRMLIPLVSIRFISKFLPLLLLFVSVVQTYSPISHFTHKSFVQYRLSFVYAGFSVPMPALFVVVPTFSSRRPCLHASFVGFSPLSLLPSLPAYKQQSNCSEHSFIHSFFQLYTIILTLATHDTVTAFVLLQHTACIVLWHREHGMLTLTLDHCCFCCRCCCR